MMKMLEEVDVDNNCVGWYQSVNLGTISTTDMINSQFNYQSSDILSTNTVVVIYDSVLSKYGKLYLKAFRLSDKYMDIKRRNVNDYIPTNEILQELPLRIKNFGHAAAYLRYLQDTHKSELDNDFVPLSLSSIDSYTEKHLEFLSSFLDDFVQEQQRFIAFSRTVSRSRQEHMKWLSRKLKENADKRENGEDVFPIRFEESNLKPLPEAPPRTDILLEIGQLDRYCNQLNEIVDGSLHKLLLTHQVGQN